MKILLFIDPTFRGDWAVTLAQDLAGGLGGTVILLTTEENVAADHAILDHAAEKLSAIPGIQIEKRVRCGPPREAIIVESRESRPAITVVPPAGRRGIARMIKGSRVKAVVHNAPSTVMVARKPVSEHIRSILVTVSGGPMSETTALCALEVAKALRAQLTLLHVTSSVSIPFGEASATPVPRGSSAVQPRTLAAVREILSKGGLEPRIRVREGMVINEILHECEDGGYDLLILGQHLIDMDAGGSFSENIAEVLAIECPIPVLVVRPRRWAEGAATEPAGSEAPAK